MPILMLLAWLSSVALTSACAHDDAPCLRMLDSRADYEAASPEALPKTLDTAINEKGVDVPVRLPPKIVHIWMHPHETSDHEYFWGGWLSVVVAGEEWSEERRGQAPTVSAKPSSKAKKSNH